MHNVPHIPPWMSHRRWHHHQGRLRAPQRRWRLQQGRPRTPHCAGTVGSSHFSITSRLANPTKGPVMAEITCSVGTSVGSLTAYTSRAFSGVGLATLQSSVGIVLPHSTAVDNISTGSMRKHTIEVPPQVTVQVTSNEPVTNSSVRTHISEGLQVSQALQQSLTNHRRPAWQSSQTDVGSLLGVRVSHNGQWALRPNQSGWLK